MAVENVSPEKMRVSDHKSQTDYSGIEAVQTSEWVYITMRQINVQIIQNTFIYEQILTPVITRCGQLTTICSRAPIITAVLRS
jgi:hypothetical protein